MAGFGRPGSPQKYERNQAMVEMRKAGATYRTIGTHFGVSHKTAHKVVRRFLGIACANKRKS